MDFTSDDSIFEHFFSRMKSHFVTKESLSISLFCLFCLFLTLIYLDSHGSVTKVNIENNEMKLIQNNNLFLHKSSFEYESSKKILLFNALKMDKSWGFSEGNEEFFSRNCEWQNCFVTSNPHQLGINRQVSH